MYSGDSEGTVDVAEGRFDDRPVLPAAENESDRWAVRLASDVFVYGGLNSPTVSGTISGSGHAAACTGGSSTRIPGRDRAGFYKRNTELGIASVIAWRPTLNEPQRVDGPEIDRHGIPRCTYCKGPTRFIRFCESPKPRLWYRCELGTFADCRKPSPQSRLCETNWKLLLPMWRTSEAYLALRNAGKHHEAPHQYWRSRYGVAGDSTDTRPKRRGIGWQQLRSNAALVVEWLRILYRMGWLGSARRVKRGTVATDGKTARDRLLTHRASLGLNRPYSFTPDGANLADPPGAPPGAGPDAEDIPF